MKIELKKLKINLTFSEETTMFMADIYVDGVLTAYARNDGKGGCTDYNSYHKPNNDETLRQAEAYAKSLPPIILEGMFGNKSISIDSTLEHIIDELVDAEVNKKETAKFDKKLIKAMENHIVWGVPNSGIFNSWGFKMPIKAVLMNPKGKEAVVNLVKKVIGEVKVGESILYKNIDEILADMK